MDDGGDGNKRRLAIQLRDQYIKCGGQEQRSTENATMGMRRDTFIKNLLFVRSFVMTELNEIRWQSWKLKSGFLRVLSSFPSSLLYGYNIWKIAPTIIKAVIRF